MTCDVREEGQEAETEDGVRHGGQVVKKTLRASLSSLPTTGATISGCARTTYCIAAAMFWSAADVEAT